MSSSEDFLNSADVNEEFNFDDDLSDDSNFDDGNDYENEDENEFGGEDDEMQMEQQKYSQELEFEDVGEPAIFNFNIHNGNFNNNIITI